LPFGGHANCLPVRLAGLEIQQIRHFDVDELLHDALERVWEAKEKPAEIAREDLQRIASDTENAPDELPRDDERARVAIAKGTAMAADRKNASDRLI
jgi:hypothetical protein